MAWPPSLALREIGHLAEHLDGPLRRGERVEELAEVLQSLDRMREESTEPARILRFGLRHVSDAQLEILAVRVHRADHDLVPEDEFQVDPVGRHFHLPVTASHAGQNEDTVLGETLHAVEDDRRVARRLEDHVEWPVLSRRIEDRNVGCRLVAGADRLDQVRVEVGLSAQAERGHLQTSKPQDERRQQADRPGTHDGGALGSPDPESSLDLVGLRDSLLHDGHGLEQDADVSESWRHLHDEFGIVDVVYGEKPVAQVDPTLEVGVVRGHVVRPDQVVDARARATNGGDDIVARPNLRHVRPDGLDLPKALVSDDQEVESSGRRTVLGRVDFLVGTVDADAEYLDQDAATARDLVHGGFRQVREMDAVRFARNDGNSFHERRPPVSELVPGSDDSPDPLRNSLRRCLTSGGISTRLTLAASSAARL